MNEKCLNDIIRYCKTEAKETQLEYWEVAFTRRDIREYAGWEHMPLRRAIEMLYEMEYIVKVYGSERSRHVYKLNMESDDQPGSVDDLSGDGGGSGGSSGCSLNAGRLRPAAPSAILALLFLLGLTRVLAPAAACRPGLAK